MYCQDSDSVESVDWSPGFLMCARNEVGPGKVRNKRRRSPILISDESISGMHNEMLICVGLLLMCARNEVGPGKVRNKRGRSPIVISDESISGTCNKIFLNMVVAGLWLVYTYHRHHRSRERYLETKPKDYIEPIFVQ